MRFPSASAAALCVLLCFAAQALAQGSAGTPPPPPTTNLVRVFLVCEGCDAALKADAPFVQYVTDRAQATVEVVVTLDTGEAAERVWVLSFTGRLAFAGQDRRMTLTVAASVPAAEVRTQLARRFKFGLTEYAMRSDVGSQLDVTISPPAATAPGAAAADRPRDPWNYWVYRLSTNGNRYGEFSSTSGYYSGSASASRTTEAWKLTFSAYKSVSTSRFRVDDDLTILTNQRNWSTDALAVKSLTAHWSAGVTGGVHSSTYSNQKVTAALNPAVEYDVFPYSESSKRSLTVQYAIGATRYQYRELTIFDKLEETKPRHSLTASLGLRQPWGSASASASFSQVLNALEQNRFSLEGGVSIRVFKGLSVNASASYSRVRDQFYLEKAGATEEEILLRLRQLATGYYFDANVGFSFSFGSLGNATVNPRFGG